jgi:hypothetical protein
MDHKSFNTGPLREPLFKTCPTLYPNYSNIFNRPHLNYAAEFSAPRQRCPKGGPPARNVLVQHSVEAKSFEPESRAIHPVILARVSEGLYPGLRIRIDLTLIRIRIRHFF